MEAEEVWEHEEEMEAEEVWEHEDAEDQLNQDFEKDQDPPDFPQQEENVEGKCVVSWIVLFLSRLQSKLSDAAIGCLLISLCTLCNYW